MVVVSRWNTCLTSAGSHWYAAQRPAPGLLGTPDLLHTEAWQKPHLLLPAVDDKDVQGEPVPGVEDVGFADVEAQVPLPAACLVRASCCVSHGVAPLTGSRAHQCL